MRKRVASEACDTGADRSVVDDLTLRVDAADSRTRVDTAVVDTSSGPGTVSCEHALGPAARVRVPRVVCTASAGPRALTLLAHSVRATWRRRARVHHFLPPYYIQYTTTFMSLFLLFIFDCTVGVLYTIINGTVTLKSKEQDCQQKQQYVTRVLMRAEDK